MHGEEDRLFLIGSFREWAADEGKALGNCISSFIFEWQWGHQVWLAQPVFEGWQQFQGRQFSYAGPCLQPFFVCLVAEAEN